MSDENRVFMVASPRTKTETRGFQDQDQDSEVPRPRPRPRLVKTGLETQVSRTPSLTTSKEKPSKTSKQEIP